jgi:hypothetical protein
MEKVAIKILLNDPIQIISPYLIVNLLAQSLLKQGVLL